jgi:hypothetical protein
MTDIQETLARAFERMLENSSPSTASDFDRLAQAFRAQIEKRTETLRANNPAAADRALAVVDQVIENAWRSTSLPQSGDETAVPRQGPEPMTVNELPKQTNAQPQGQETKSQSGTRSLIIGGLVGAIAGGLAMFGATKLTTGPLVVTIPAEDIVAVRQAAPELIDAVAKMREIIEKSPEQMAVSAEGNLVPAAQVFPDIFNALSPEVRNGLGFFVRTEGSAYKILLSGRLCPVITTDPMFARDPKRESDFAMLCQFYGVWNDAGADL